MTETQVKSVLRKGRFSPLAADGAPSQPNGDRGFEIAPLNKGRLDELALNPAANENGKKVGLPAGIVPIQESSTKRGKKTLCFPISRRDF